MSKREGEEIKVNGKRMRLPPPSRKNFDVGINRDKNAYAEGPVFTGILRSYKEKTSKEWRIPTIKIQLTKSVLLQGGRNTYKNDPEYCEVVKDPFGNSHLRVNPYFKEKGKEHKRRESKSGFNMDYPPHFFHPGRVVTLKGPLEPDDKDKPAAFNDNDINTLVECVGVYIVVMPYKDEKTGQMQFRPALSCGDVRRVTFEDGSPASAQGLNFIEANLIAFGEPLDMPPEDNKFFGHALKVPPQIDFTGFDKEWINEHITEKYNPSYNISLLTLPETASAPMKAFTDQLPEDFVTDLQMNPEEWHEKDFQTTLTDKVKDVEHTFNGMRTAVWVPSKEHPEKGIFVVLEMQRSIFNEGPLNALGLTRDVKMFGGIWTSLSMYTLFHAPILWRVSLDLKTTLAMRENETAFTTFATRMQSVNVDIRSMLQTVGIPITKELAKRIFDKVTASRNGISADLASLMEAVQGIIPLYSGTPRTKALFDETKEQYTFWMLRPLISGQMQSVLRTDETSKTIADYVRHIREKCKDDPVALSELVMVEKAQQAAAIGDRDIANFVEFRLPTMASSMDRVPIFAVRGSMDDFPVSARHMNIIRSTVSPQYDSDERRVVEALTKAPADGLPLSEISIKACVGDYVTNVIVQRMVNDGTAFMKWDTNPQFPEQQNNIRYGKLSECAMSVMDKIKDEGCTLTELAELAEATKTDPWQLSYVLEQRQVQGLVFFKDEKYFKI